MKQNGTPAKELSISVNMLGGFSMEVSGKTLTDDINRSQKLWNVLCYLIVHRDRTVPQSEFISLFWPDENSANPVNALKTLLYRVRAMLEPLFPQDMPPILSQRGAYAWNPAVRCTLDTDRFEELCRQGQDAKRSDEERMEAFRQALALYRGDFLPKQGGHMWLVVLSTRYHTLYIQAVKDYAALLEAHGEYQEMVQTAERALTLDDLDEELYILVIRGLVAQGQESAALEHYQRATDILYRNLGVTPSDELRALYSRIMDTEGDLETDLEVVQNSLRETASRPGAFVCEYGFFREAYRLEARRAARSGNCVHLALITVTLPGGGIPELNVLNTTMDRLLDVIVSCLRRGDVVARYSGAQYVILLPAANFEDSTMVMERIVSTFNRQYRRNFLKLVYRIREMDLS